MVINSFSLQGTSYQTTSKFCTCPDFVKRNKAATGETCKHMRKVARIEDGRPLTVSAARAARIQRNRQTCNAYYRMSLAQYDEF